jgi:Fic family protein
LYYKTTRQIYEIIKIKTRNYGKNGIQIQSFAGRISQADSQKAGRTSEHSVERDTDRKVAPKILAGDKGDGRTVWQKLTYSTDTHDDDPDIGDRINIV